MLALVVIGIGLTAVMVLPVIATRASRDAVAYSHAADTGQWVSEYLSRDAALVAGLPAGPVAMPDTSTPPGDDPAHWQAVAAQPGLWRGVGAGYAGIYRYYATRQRGAVNTVMRCWREPHVVTWPDGSQTVSQQVTVELTWPATAAPRDRERVLFAAMAAD